MGRWMTWAFAVALGVLPAGCQGSEEQAQPTAPTAVPEAAQEAGLAARVPATPKARPSATRTDPAMGSRSRDATELPFDGTRIALVHTANVMGELEPCG